MRAIDGCEFRGRRDGVAVVVCPPGLGDEALCRAGRGGCGGACGGAGGGGGGGEPSCTAWFWDEPALAPAAPPTPERPMSEAQADAAVAVYLADTDRLCRAARDERAA